MDVNFAPSPHASWWSNSVGFLPLICFQCRFEWICLTWHLTWDKVWLHVHAFATCLVSWSCGLACQLPAFLSDKWNTRNRVWPSSPYLGEKDYMKGHVVSCVDDMAYFLWRKSSVWILAESQKCIICNAWRSLPGTPHYCEWDSRVMMPVTQYSSGATS